jgi:hypothetical protein
VVSLLTSTVASWLKKQLKHLPIFMLLFVLHLLPSFTRRSVYSKRNLPAFGK